MQYLLLQVTQLVTRRYVAVLARIPFAKAVLPYQTSGGRLCFSQWQSHMCHQH